MGRNNHSQFNFMFSTHKCILVHLSWPSLLAKLLSQGCMTNHECGVFFCPSLRASGEFQSFVKESGVADKGDSALSNF